jgi:hypothetical protein
MTRRPFELRPEWEALQQEAAALAAEGEAQRGLPADDPKVEAHEAKAAALVLQKDMLAAAAWLSDARDLGDVRLLAELVWDLYWGLGTFPDLPPDIEDRGQREVAVAHLVRGVFDAHRAKAVTTDGADAKPDHDTTQPEQRQAGTSSAAGERRTELPDLDDLVERARDGLITLRTLWNAHAILPGGVLPEGSVAFAAAIEFVVDSLDGVLDDSAEIAAANAGGGAAGEAERPA